MKTIRKIIQIDEEKCDGCGSCVTGCAENALAIVNGKARVVSDNLCDGLGACIGECPQGALKIIEREADPFDEAAVAAQIELSGRKTPGCDSALSNWPVQIHLVRPDAPFLKDADLLVAADCVPVAFPDFHRVFLQGRAVMLGCPKLDNAQAYVDKFAAVFTTARIKSLTVVVMEVPCCNGLPRILQEALSRADVNIPFQQVVVSSSGNIIRESMVSKEEFNQACKAAGPHRFDGCANPG